jgi:hypothetical protein
MRTLLATAILAAATTAHAAPMGDLKPMAFLAGHCWKGAFPGGAQTDEHCFTWLYGGRALRDTHVVRTPGKPDYAGETTYVVNPATKVVQFFYFENLGGLSQGVVESVPDGLVFPATDYVGEGESMTYRVRWTKVGDDAYEAWSEAKTPNGWTTMFKLALRRQP